MKRLLIRLTMVIIGIAMFTACNKDDDFTTEIDVESVHTVSCREQVLKIPISSNADWELIKENNRWCVLNQKGGKGNDTLVLRIAENIDYKERKISIGIGNPGASKIIQVTQQAATEEYHYKLPVIFHILYDDASNPQQNVDANVITAAIEAANAYWRNSANSVDMNLEFVLATHDPQGNLLEEPGIKRVYSTTPITTSCDEFMSNPEVIQSIWDMNRYINIFTFPFTEKNVLGISRLPYTVGYDPLGGLYNGDVFFDYPTELYLPHCIALNTEYLLTEHPTMLIQDFHITLAHELGHYLGLFHVFEEDYCDDTETYDRNAYEQWLSNNISSIAGFEDLARRTSPTGTSYVSYNIMDYDYSYMNQFTLEQRKRLRHVLENSPLIPGPKHTDYRTRSTRSTEIPKPRLIR